MRKIRITKGKNTKKEAKRMLIKEGQLMKLMKRSKRRGRKDKTNMDKKEQERKIKKTKENNYKM